MTVEVEKDLGLSAELAEWFWEFGVHRQSKYPAYAISTSEWVKIVYEVRKELATVNEAAKATRPCCAIWGPSQTGKSTLVSAYLDEKATITGVPGEDGTGSALHWPGGEPALFMDPETIRGKKAAPGVNILNPFNNRKDASACLSRFTYGTLTPRTGAYHVANPKYPMQIRLVTEKDLLHALARGVDSECWGHALNGSQKYWDLDRLDEEIAYFQSRLDPNLQDGAVDRRAYELLHDFCEVLDDLVFAGLKRFRDIGLLDRKYRSALGSILAEKSLIGSIENAEQLIARVFWDECEQVTDYYRRMRDALRAYKEMLAGKTLHCDISTAVLLLDMDIYEILSNPTVLDSTIKGRKDPRKVAGLVQGLSYRIQGDRVLLGQGLDKPLFAGDLAGSFAILQGLVWELVIPLNSANIAEGPFREYLEQADLLDFPGVANVAPNPSTMVRCECSHRERDSGGPATPAAPVSAGAIHAPPKFDASTFFTQILKRGKTASIVSTYAKSLTIDGFVIFQNIDGIPAVNSEQLQTGIMTWWKAMVPSYFQDHEGKPSPLPLYLGLLWWKNVFDEADPARPRFANYAWIWKNLGKLGDPRIVRTFALNYYRLLRGQPQRDSESLKVLIEQIRRDEDFRAQFNNPVSLESFEAMISREGPATEGKTGGANFFFEQLCLQISGPHQQGQFNRAAILEGKAQLASSRIQGVIEERNLFPPPEDRDVRRENLIRLRDLLKARTQPKAAKDRFLEPRMRALNYALRVFLNINQDDLNSIPSNPLEISEQFILDQYQRWINCQVDRLRRTAHPEDGSLPVEWGLIGVGGEADCRDFLGALVASLDPKTTIKEMAHWLARLVQFVPNACDGAVDCRSYLATRMANEIVYGPQGLPAFDPAMQSDLDGAEDDGLSIVPSGKDCPSYQVFVRDFVERRLPELIDRRVPAQVVPQDLPGVQELRALCAKYGRAPRVEADPAAAT